jgi:hypothetical protein
MTFPAQQLNVIDPGLGVTAPVAGTPVISGHAFGGTGEHKKVISIGALDQVRTVLGYGPLAEDVALALQQRGGPVLAMIHDDEANTPIDVAMTGPEEGSPEIGIAGVPRDYYNVLVEIMAGGDLGEATFRYSLDAFDDNVVSATMSQTRTVPLSGTFVIPNSGLTLTFDPGDAEPYVTGDEYTYSATPPRVTSVDLSEIAAVLEATPSLDFHLWLVSGTQVDEGDASALASSFGGYLESLTNTFRYVRGFIDIGSGDLADDVLEEAGDWTASRVCPAYGFVLRNSALPFEGYAVRKVSCVSGIGVRAMRELISSDLSRFASGPDEGVLSIEFDGFYNQLLDAQKLSTMRTWAGIPGFYIANGKLKSPFGSDFTDVQFGRVMDVACRTTYLAQLPFVSEGFRTVADPAGAIDPLDAADIINAVQSALNDNLASPNNARGIPGHVSAVVYSVDLQHNIVTTGQLKTSVGIRPLGYSKEFLTDLFFTLNP